MDLNNLAERFNRALRHAFHIKTCFVLFAILVISGVITLFFELIAAYSPSWLMLPLRGVAIFFVVGFLLGGGTFIIQLYERQKGGEALEVRRHLINSWELLIKASYLAFPLLLAFLLFWLSLGVFLLLKSIPYVGTILAVILAFGPFLLNLAMLLLFLAALLLFFFATPSLAVSGKVGFQQTFRRLGADLFKNLLFLVVGFFPIWIVWKFLNAAASLTREIYFVADTPLENVLQGFFMMLPFVALLTPAVNFFFNFASECYDRAWESGT